MSKEVLEAFMPLAIEEHFKAGEMIFEEGSSADKFFIVKAGEVEIRKVVDRKKERYKLIAVLARGEFFGEMAIFLGQPRTAEALAKTDVTVLTISKTDLSDLFEQDPSTAFKVLESLSSVLMDRLGNTTKELVTVYETGRLVTAARSVEEISDHVMEGITSAMETEAVLLVVWNEFNGEFEVCGQKGFDIEEGVYPGEDALVRWLTENRESFLSFDLREDTRLQMSEDSIYRGRSLVASPFFSKNTLVGFLMLLDREAANAFSYNHMVLLSAISGYVTVALENMKYMQEEIARDRLAQARSSMQF
jgi:CRP-like cAMP-binding protein